MWSHYVHCRTGSLEKAVELVAVAVEVHCRTGSLEINISSLTLVYIVHCRTGSLEKAYYN